MIYKHLCSPYLSTEVILQIIADYIQVDANRYVAQEDGKRRRFSRTQYNVNNVEDLWNTPWGVMLQDDDLLNNHSRASKRFRRRFRVSYPIFLYMVRRCKDLEVFGTTKIPYEMRILIGLRILGRGNCADDIFELSGIAESTVNTIFHQFTEVFVHHFYDEYISFPSGQELKRVTR